MCGYPDSPPHSGLFCSQPSEDLRGIPHCPLHPIPPTLNASHPCPEVQSWTWASTQLWHWTCLVPLASPWVP